MKNKEIEQKADVNGVDDVPDPYRNLENLEDPGTQKWIQTEADKAEAYFKTIPIRDKLRGELTKLFAFDSFPSRSIFV